MELEYLIIGSILVLFASILIDLTYKIFSKKKILSGYTGKDVALKILNEYDIDVEVGRVSGNLTDYYNNASGEIRLSDGTYDKSTVAAVAVAAHECGHAIQYKDGYKPIILRNMLIPVINFSTIIGYVVIFISIISSFFKSLLIPGIILISLGIILEILTLPIEVNASRRAKKALLELEIIEKREGFGVSLMLMSAAFTYFASLVSSILQLIRLILIAKDND